ncbi:MAG: hypothetical protein AAFR46_04460 [Pseudomonadota bacterium]
MATRPRHQMKNLDRAKDRTADRADSKKKVGQQAARDRAGISGRGGGLASWKRLKAQHDTLRKSYLAIKAILEGADEERKRKDDVAKALAKVIKAAGELLKDAQKDVKSGTLQTTPPLDKQLQGMKTQIDGLNGLMIVMAFLATYFAQKLK